MAKGPAQQAPSELSYELYQELLEELLSPIEVSLDLGVRYELYLSKLVYLENLQAQCFRSVNANRNHKFNPRENYFTQKDLETIQEAISSTHEFLRATILEALETRLSRIGFQDVSL